MTCTSSSVPSGSGNDESPALVAADATPGAPTLSSPAVMTARGPNLAASRVPSSGPTIMASAEGKEIYKERAATSETVNADLRQHRALKQFAVRGLKKIKCVTLWCALAYNLMIFGMNVAHPLPRTR